MNCFKDIKEVVQKTWIKKTYKRWWKNDPWFVESDNMMKYENTLRWFISNKRDEHVAALKFTILEKFALNYQKNIKIRRVTVQANTIKLWYQKGIYTQDLKINLPWFTFLNPMPLKDIFKHQNEDRDTLYANAAARIRKIQTQASSYNVVSRDIQQCLTSTDYDEIKRFNKSFDAVDEIKLDNFSKTFTYFQQFASFFKAQAPSVQHYKSQTDRIKKFCFHPIKSRINKKFANLLAKYMRNPQQLARSYQDYSLIYFNNIQLKQGFDPQNKQDLPDHQNNQKLKEGWQSSQFWRKITLQLDYFTFFLWKLDSKPIFGGKDKSQKGLQQLRNKDWRNYGKQLIKKIYKKEFELGPKLDEPQQKQRGGKKKFIKEHKAKITGFADLFFFVDQEMQSNVFATSFYKYDYQPPDYIENGNYLPRFELICIKNPMLLCNKVEGWMRQAFFQELLTDLYFKLFNQVYEKQKQLHLNREFKRLVEAEDLRELKEVEAQYAAIANEIYEKGFCFSPFDEFKPDQITDKQTSSLKSQNFDTFSHVDLTRRQDLDEFYDVDFSHCYLKAKSPIAKLNLQLEFSLKNDPIQANQTALSAVQTNVLTPIHEEQADQIEIVEEQAEIVSQKSKENHEGSQEKRNEFYELQKRFFKLVDENGIDTLSGRAIPKLTIQFLQSTALSKKDKHQRNEKNIDPITELNSSFAVSQPSVIEASSEDQQLSSQIVTDSQFDEVSSIYSTIQQREAYRRNLEDPAHLSFNHIQIDDVLLGKKDDLQQDIKNPLIDLQSWIENGSRKFKFKVDEAIKQKKEGRVFEDMESILSMSDSDNQEKFDLLSDASHESRFTKNSINSTNFIGYDIFKKYEDRGLGQLLDSIHDDVVDNTQKPKHKKTSKKRIQQLYLQAKEEEIRMQMDTSDKAEMQDQLAQFVQINSDMNSKKKEKQMAFYFRKQLEKQFFKAIMLNNVNSVFNYIIRFGVDLETKDELGNTALNLAAQSGFSELVNELLAMGADKNNANIEGKAAAYYVDQI